MTFMFIIFVIGGLGLLAWNVYMMEENDERKEELDKYSVHLDEKANLLAQWEDDLRRRENGEEEGE